MLQLILHQIHLFLKHKKASALCAMRFLNVMQFGAKEIQAIAQLARVIAQQAQATALQALVTAQRALVIVQWALATAQWALVIAQRAQAIAQGVLVTDQKPEKFMLFSFSICFFLI